MKLSEMKGSPDLGLPVRTHPICVAGKLSQQLEESDDILAGLYGEIESLKVAGGSERAKARNAARLRDLSVQAEKQAETSDEIRERMEAHTIDLQLQGKDGGGWRAWARKHPARDRDDDRQGAERDMRWSGGTCNIDELIEAMPDFIVAYGEEPPAPDSWSFVSANAAPGDLTKLASTVVRMHEQGVDLGKSRRTLLADLTSENDSQ
jgi:hypothetical protein